MDNPRFMKFMASEPFTIVVQDAEGNPKEYLIHSDLLASMSRSLQVLVKGSMREAQEKRVVWDIDERTMALFSEFAYTGDYHVAMADPTKPCKSSIFGTGNADVGQEASGEEDEGDGDSDGDEDFQPEDESLSETESEQDEEMNAPTEVDSQLIPKNRDNSPISKEFITDECMAHARLLIVADYHGMDSLVSLSRGKLDLHLQRISEYSWGAITELISSTHDFPDCLQQLLAGHILSNVRGLWANGQFRQAMENRPKLMSDVISGFVAKRATRA